jgi:threonylcarbamoyladenosine tRNA methylthiotransferase MtaB
VSGRATVVTHGCRSNLAEADALARHWGGGVTVINSCAVTGEAVRDARAAARAAITSGAVVLTGCAATIAPERFRDLPVRIVPNAAKLSAPWGSTRRSRGFVAVQDGCDHHCTFCVTRLARGSSRSRPVRAVVDEVARMAEAGVAEVVLTGIDATGYADGAQRLGHLVQAILARVPALPRLRLSSLDCAEVDDALVEAFAEPRLMPHVHLSLQSGDPLILKRMRRRHAPGDAIRLVERLQRIRPEIAFGADLIAGFPTEGEAAHRASLSLLESCDIVHAHVFPYSPRPGTAAARMPQIAPPLVRARAAALRARASERRRRWLEGLAGRPTEVVSEGPRGIAPQGHFVRFASPRPQGARETLCPSHIIEEQLAE